MTNNLGSRAAKLLGLTDLETGTYLNQFHCVPAAAPIVPAFQRKPTSPQAQTALVVGLASEALPIDRDQRVKVDANGIWGHLHMPGQGSVQVARIAAHEQATKDNREVFK